METENQVDPNIALNAAANLILNTMQEPARSILIDCAQTTLQIPNWQLISGLLELVFHTGQYVEPILNPDWLRSMPVEAVVFEQAVCGYEKCGKTFTPRWPRKVFCSNSCGSAAQREAATTRTPEHIVGGKHPLGQEPEGMLSSALQRKDS